MSSNPAKSEHSNKAPIELFNWLVFDLKKKQKTPPPPPKKTAVN